MILTTNDVLKDRAKRLGLFGLLARWSDLEDEPWLDRLLGIEEEERQRRSLERRLRFARIGPFKPLADFDWNWPEEIDREIVEDLFTFQFITDKANVVLVGPNGVGKSMIAQNLAQQAILRGYRVRFTGASAMLNDLASQEGAFGLARCLRKYSHPELLVIDEIGYLNFDNRHADLLFEVMNRRYEQRSTIITTNKPFKEWHEVFPNAACVVTLVDRLVHHAEIVAIRGDSYRLKEAQEREAERASRRAAHRKAEKRA